MFQTFDAKTSPDDAPPRLAALREAMRGAGLGAMLVPRADAHQGEYVAPCDERLAWLTGFTGSAGSAAILMDRAALFADGRYRVQGRAQVPEEIEIVAWPETTVADWLTGAMEGGTVGFDPWLHTIREVAKLRADLSAASIGLSPAPGLVDSIWPDRPGPPSGPITPYPEDLAGESSASKRARVAETLAAGGQSAAVLTAPDSIAWLLNVRGADIERIPVPHAFAILHADGRVDLFARPGKTDALPPEEGLAIHDAAAFEAALGALSGPVRVDPASAAQAIADILAEAGVEIAEGPDPCALPKARKNETELAGIRDAHLRDGAAMVRFLAWLDAEAPGSLTEIAVAKALEGFRRETNALREISFDSIVGSGPNGAIVHYRVTEGTDRALREGELLLVDSGGQYLDGTTDITRTIAIGPPGEAEREAFTLVLKGMIAISRIRFPRGVGGQHLDALARAPLWMAGKDYDHGTGHGVGHYLSVHEGPQGISRRSAVALEPGMILSNEPGYYAEGAFGIRIENLIAVREAPALPGADARPWLDFETLTFVPIDRRLVDLALLDQGERDWIDAYHAKVRERIAPLVDGPAADWLSRATEPL